MSGGVDSSVAALLLKEQGYEVIGIFMKNWDDTDEFGHCTAEEDAEDVRRVCDQLDIPFYTVNFEKQYYDKVFAYFLDEYTKGRTPNPDVMCNREIKFGELLQKVIDLAGDYIATGHYAQVKEQDGEFVLMRGNDANKDQTYFLNVLNQQQLSKAMFPIGHLPKPKVREIAEAAGLLQRRRKIAPAFASSANVTLKSSSANICLLSLGNMVDIRNGEVKGRHDGLMYYTLGQRQGLGIGGSGSGSGEPWFVVDKNLESNELLVVQGEQYPGLYSKGLTATDVNWISPNKPEGAYACTAKFRYRQARSRRCHYVPAGW